MVPYHVATEVTCWASNILLAGIKVILFDVKEILNWHGKYLILY